MEHLASNPFFFRCATSFQSDSIILNGSSHGGWAGLGRHYAKDYAKMLSKR
jgi:hypothetical protein